MKKYVVGVDIGGTKSAIVLAKNQDCPIPDKMLVDRIEFKTLTGVQAKQGIENLSLGISDILNRNSIGASDVSAIGISCGGPVNSKEGLILSPPNLYGWDSVPICRILSERFFLPVYLQNDANACALAEWKYGAGKGYSNLVFLTMGTGMGAGLIFDSRLYAGTNDMAGEVGHMRLSCHGPVGFAKEGSFEGFCSGGGIAQTAKVFALERLQSGQKTGYCASYADLESITAKTVGDAAEQGDEIAIQVYKRVGTYLGLGISLIIDMLNPEIIVIGSIFQRSERLLREEMEREISLEALALNRSVCAVVPAKLADRVGDFAAITVAQYKNGAES